MQELFLQAVWALGQAGGRVSLGEVAERMGLARWHAVLLADSLQSKHMLRVEGRGGPAEAMQVEILPHGVEQLGGVEGAA